MFVGRAFFAGIAGALAMSVFSAMARSLDVPINISLLLGTIPGWVPSRDTWTLGFVLNLLIGGLFALPYAWMFEYVTHTATSAIGARLGALHAIAVGGLLTGVPAVHAGVPELLPAPGAFMVAYGYDGIVVFFLVHLVYGAVVGGLYGSARI